MNAHHKSLYVRLMMTAVLSLVLAVFMLSSAYAAPCFDDPKRAYEYLLQQEQSADQLREHTRININRASEGELVSLNGIGSSKAQAIILYRDMFGDFETIDELAKVKGIGIKTVEKNRQRLSIAD